MGILDDLKKAFQNTVQQSAPQQTQQRKLDTPVEQTKQPTAQMTNLTNAINKWASQGKVDKNLSARRKLFYEPEPQKNWYSGDVPTNSEILARIYTIGQTDKKQSEELFNMYQTFVNDPSSYLYNPYKQSTNKALAELQNLGIDTSKGIDEKWINDNSWLMNYYRTETGNTPLSPSSKSSAEQNAAYWYYKVLSAEETTQKAETEWQALQDEITYWAKRTDRNYSDDEILKKIDWSNYKTLTGMDADAAKGVPTVLNRPVGYSTDALKGVIWAARNGSTGDTTTDSVNAVLGRGKSWLQKDSVTQKLDPTSSRYSPYSVGSTIDDAALYFNVQEFDKNWLENNRAYLASDDTTERKMYTKVYNAEQNTQKAETELAALNKQIDEWIKGGITDPDKLDVKIANYVEENCPTLNKMDESLKSGDLMSMTRAVNYKLQDIQTQVRNRCVKENTKVLSGDFVQNLAKKFNTNIKAFATDTQVQKWRNAFVKGAADTILRLGTDEEKIAFANAGTADYPAFVQDIITTIQSELANGQQIVDDAKLGADAYVKENYFDAYGVVTQYEQAQQQYDEAMKHIEELTKQEEEKDALDDFRANNPLPGYAMASGGGSDTFVGPPQKMEDRGYEQWYANNREQIDSLKEQMIRAGTKPEEAEEIIHNQYRDLMGEDVEEESQANSELNYWKAEAENAQARMQELQAQYDEKRAILEEAQANYEALERTAALYGIKVEDADSLMRAFEAAWNLGAEPIPTEWLAYNTFDMAMNDIVTQLMENDKSLSREDAEKLAEEHRPELVEKAKEGRLQCAESLAYIDSLLYTLGVTDNDDPMHAKDKLLPDDVVNNINRVKESIERKIYETNCWLLPEEDWFDDAVQEELDNVGNHVTWSWNKSVLDSYVEMAALYIKNPDYVKSLIDSETGDIAADIDLMTDAERKTLLAIHKHDGADAAQEYIDFMFDPTYGMLVTRKAENSRQRWEEWTQSSVWAGIGMNAIDVLASPIRALGFAYSYITSLSGNEINPNSKWFAASTLDSAVKTTSKQAITNYFGEGTAASWLANLGYDALSSLAESMYGGAVFRGSNIVVMGAQAAASAVQDAKSRGASDEQALAIGAVTFAAESLTEVITFNNLKKAFSTSTEEGVKTLKELAFGVLQDAFGEEAPGEMINELVEGVADTWIMGQYSELETEISYLMHENGLTRTQAEQQATNNFVKKILYAGLTGALSGATGVVAGDVASGKLSLAVQLEIISKRSGIPVESLAESYTKEAKARQEAAKAAEQAEKPAEATEEKAKPKPEIPQQAMVEEGESTQTPAETTEAKPKPEIPQQATIEETTETPATEEKPAPEIRPVDNSRFGTAGGSNSRAVNAAAALTASLSADTATQTATVAASLSPVDGKPVIAASTAAQHLANQFGPDGAVRIVNDIMLTTAENNMDMEAVQVAVTTAALNEGGQAHTMLADMQKNGVTVENLNGLIQEANVEANDPAVASEMEATIRENNIAEHVKALVADGALNGLEPMKQAVTDAKNKRRAAKSALTKQVNKFTALQNAYTEAQTKWREDPTNKELKAAKKTAREKMKAQSEVVNEYQQRMQNAEDAVTQAEETLQNAENQAMNDLRQQAQEQIAQEEEQAAAVAEQQKQAEAEAQAQADEQRQTNNAHTLDVDTFIAEAFPNATEEEKATIREIFEAKRKEMTDPVEIKKRERFVKNLSRKFGVNIQIADTTQGGTQSRYLGSYDEKTNTITLDKGVTQTNAIYAVALHELTHMAERSGLYDKLASALTRIAYRNADGTFNEAQLANDIRARQQLYNNWLAQNADQNANNTQMTSEQASKEVVADLTRKILFGDEASINALVAEDANVARRMLNGIKNFLNKMRGVDDPAITQLQKTRRLFEKALKEAQRNIANGKNTNSEKQYMLVGQDPDTGRSVYVSNFAEGTTALEKGKRIIDLLQNVWSKKPVTLTIIEADGTQRTIQAEFNPDFDERYYDNSVPRDQLRKTDAGKIAFGNHMGTSSARRVMLNLADDYYQLLEDSQYYTSDSDNGSKHPDVNQWNYFLNDIYYADQGSDSATPYRIEIDVKETDDGNFVYTYWAEQQNEQQKKLSLMGIRPVNADNVGESATASVDRVSQNQEAVKPIAENNDGTVLASELPGGTVTKQYSLSSWSEQEEATVRENLINKGFDPADVDKWIGDVNSVASIISADKARLDYAADSEKTMLKPNEDYEKTLDASTLCAKRLLYQGTFNAIQHLLPNTPLMPEDLIDLVNMLKDAGYESPCGICYVESRRRHLGKFAQEWLDSYDGEYKPTLDEVTTTDGLESLRTSPDKARRKAYEDFVTAMNKKGSANPKVVQLRTDYKGEIRDMTKGQKAKVVAIGGLRVQSFSDFETPHLIDMMQAVLDMAAEKLTSQAYTKVPNFAWVFGDTGIKINLSLIGEGNGVNADGNLIFSSSEGMDFDEAMKLRDRYSKNVGTILVGMNDAHILAAMADDRIDFIIPFHKSGWSANELAKVRGMQYYSNYESTQNERTVVTDPETGKQSVKNVKKNFQPVGPNGYWDFSKSGKENAETYLRMCAEDGRIPKFNQFLVDNGDGSYSLQPDGSTDGYWKTLIDFKMYDNEGVGSPQQAVTPNVNMEEAVRVLSEYEGNADTLPVANDIVDQFVEKYKSEHPNTQYSLPSRNILEEQIEQYLSGGYDTFGRNLPDTTNQITTNRETTGNERQRQFGSQTAQRSDALHDEVKDYLLKNSSYIGDTNRAQIERAINWVKDMATEADPNGYQAALKEVLSDDFNYASGDGQARMLTVMQMAALQGDVANEKALADSYNSRRTDIAQALQSGNIFHMMTPLGRTAALQGEVDRINQQYMAQGKSNRVALPDEIIREAAIAQTPEEFDAVRHEAYKILADQMPPTWKEQLQAWRMLSMLANPRTHVRNFIGNAVFMPAVALKNVIATGLEHTVNTKNVHITPDQRTKSIRVSKDLKAYAKADADNIQDILRSEKKYNPTTEVNAERKMFGVGNSVLSKTFGKALQKVSDFNSWALEAEDWLFLKKHYTNALAGWMQARGISSENITDQQLAEGREYAILEAQKATYRDANEIATQLSKISANGGKLGFIIDAALPFKKTPANILRRGIEYSPVGLINTLATSRKRMMQYEAWQSGELKTKPKTAMSPQQFIDGIAAGLSGTAITALGALLSALGVVTVSLDDDKDEFDKLEGKQEYGINFNLFGFSYTFDWAAPVCMPLFVGASIYDAMTDEDASLDAGAIADSVLQITEPVFNLSMLDGVNSLLNISTWGSGNAITQVGEKLATNYISSFVPTVLGQVSRTIDPVRRKSYVESGASLSTWRYAIEQIQNKTPFSVANIPYRNAWGEEDRSPVWLAAFENFISPGYINKLGASAVDEELRRLYESTSKDSLIPELPNKSIDAGGEKIKLNDKQYDQYTKERGQTAKSVIEGLMGRPEWQLLSDYDRATLVEDAFTYADQVAKLSIAPNYNAKSWVVAANSGDPVQAITQRLEDNKKEDYVNGYKTALNEAISSGDSETAYQSITALKEAGVDLSSLKSSLTKQWKPVYVEAVKNGDTETARTIYIMLNDLNIGYSDKNDFNKWIN